MEYIVHLCLSVVMNGVMFTMVIHIPILSFLSTLIYLLQVQTTDGSYIPATPIPGTIVVNIGDLMQRWTADKLKSTVRKGFYTG